MSDQSTEATTATARRAVPTKAASVQKLLSRPKGATLAEIMDATGWLPHSARAFMTGLRRNGHALVRECRTNGQTSWRIER